MVSQGLNELPGARGLWLRTQVWCKRKMHGVWNLETLSSSSSHVPPPLYPTLLIPLVLTCRQLSCPPIRRVCRGQGKKGKKTQTFRLGCSDTKEKCKASYILPDLHLWDAILLLPSTLPGKRHIGQNFHRNSGMWPAYLSQHQEPLWRQEGVHVSKKKISF